MSKDKTHIFLLSKTPNTLFKKNIFDLEKALNYDVSTVQNIYLVQYMNIDMYRKNTMLLQSHFNLCDEMERDFFTSVLLTKLIDRFDDYEI